MYRTALDDCLEFSQPVLVSIFEYAVICMTKGKILFFLNFYSSWFLLCAVCLKGKTAQRTTLLLLLLLYMISHQCWARYKILVICVNSLAH